MGTQVTYAPNLPEIPSEYIEKYFERYFMMQLEALSFGLITPEEVRQNLRVIAQFARCFTGIHCQYAVSNEYGVFNAMSDENMIDIAKQTFKDE